MRRRAVVLVSYDGDEHGTHLATLLRNRGADPIRVSYDDAVRSAFVWDPRRLTLGFRPLPSDASGLWRRAGTLTTATSAEYAQFVASEWKDAFEGSLAAAPIKWLSTLGAMRHAELKIVQLAEANRLGIRHPRTLVTNDARAAKAFVAAHPSVVKPVRYGLVSTSPPRMAWTRDITPADIARLHGPPIILQQRVSVRYHLRIVTVTDRIFASRLETEDLDWRVDAANHERFRPADDAAKDVGDWPTLLAGKLHLNFSAQDWIVDRSGYAFFLDLNPNGQWLFLDPGWNGAIGAAIADALIER